MWPYLDVAVVVAGVAAEARVDENGVQVVYQWIPMRLGHVGAQVEVLRVPHILCRGELIFNQLLFDFTSEVI